MFFNGFGYVLGTALVVCLYISVKTHIFTNKRITHIFIKLLR